jgi:DNA-binding NtrC family response regulator
MPGDLFPEQGRDRESAAAMVATLAEVRDDAERRQIERTLAAHGGQLQKTAEALGISRTTLWEKMKRYGLPNGRPFDG